MTWFLLFVSNFGGSWNLSIIFGTLIIFDPPMMSLILYMFLQFSHAFYPSNEKNSGNKKPRCSKGMIGRSRLQMWTSWMPFTREEHKIFAAKRRLQSDFISRIHCSNRLQCIDEVMIIYKKCTLWIQDLDDKKGCKVVTQETNQTWEIKHNQQEQWRQVKPEDWFKTFWSKLPNFSLANDHMQRACCACHYAMCHTHLSSQWLTSWTSRHFFKNEIQTHHRSWLLLFFPTSKTSCGMPIINLSDCFGRWLQTNCLKIALQTAWKVYRLGPSDPQLGLSFETWPWIILCNVGTYPYIIIYIYIYVI